MKVYVAAPWVHMLDARRAAVALRAAGFTITSRWLELDPTDDKTKTADEKRAEAMKDVADVQDADALVYLNLAKSEGKATELGMCIAQHKAIFVIGGKENNVFLHSDYVQHVADLDAAIVRLKDVE